MSVDSSPAARLRAAADLLESLDKAATPGPWESGDWIDGQWYHRYGNYGWSVTGPGFEGEDSDRGGADVDLTATLRNAAPHLAAWLRATARSVDLAMRPTSRSFRESLEEQATRVAGDHAPALAVADAVLLASANTPAEEADR